MAENVNLFVTDCNPRSVKAEWNIARFFKLPKKLNYCLESDRFMFSNKNWFFSIYPNGLESDPGWIGLFLNKEWSTFPLRVTFTIGMRRADGSVLTSHYSSEDFTQTEPGWGARHFIEKSELLKLKNIISPDGCLRIYCSARLDDGAPTTCRPTEFHHTNVPPKSLKKHAPVETCLSAFVPTFPSDSSLSSESEHDDFKRIIKELREKLAASEKEKEAILSNTENKLQEAQNTDRKLSENLKQLFQTGSGGDITVKVENREFVVHKLILGARSSVYRIMFETDMTEKNDGVVNIEDCEAGPFEDFLLFLYSGQFDIVTPSNALKLCLIADKYNVEQLKEACFEILAKTISVESVCDVVYLASLFSKREILNSATNFFIENMDKVICSPKWISFLAEHPTTANELLVKLAQKSKK